MLAQKIFCSACDREVSVVFTDEQPAADAAPNLADADVVCLELGDQCTGALCPVCAISPEAMAIRVAKLGLRPDQHATVRAACEGCQREQDMMLTRGGYVTCPECGATRRMRRV